MISFGGDTTHPMDVKGRISLPAKQRRMLPDELTVIPSPDKQFPSLWIYSEEAFEEWVDSVIEGKGGFQANSKSANHYRREMHRKVENVSIDQLGRILIPVHLRQYASLEKSVRVIGAGTHIEIWNEDILAQNDEFYSKQPEAEIFDLP